MFFIMVANTNDETIGKCVQKDLDNLSGLYPQIAKELGISQVFTTKIYGDNFNKATVEKALSDLAKQKPSPIDIVIFQYSGHGYRLPGDVSPYARIAFRTPDDRKKNIVGDNMPLEDVYKRIKALNPRVCMVFGDCCNANIYDNAVFGLTKAKGKGGGQLGTFNLSNAEKLFLPALPLSMLVGSVSKDHLAVMHPETGGYFTDFFTAELEKNLWGYYNNSLSILGVPGNASWLRIIVNARENTYWKSKARQCGATENDRCIQQAEFSLIPLQ